MTSRRVDFTVRKMGDIPEPHAVRRSEYQEIVELVRDTKVGRGLDCANRKDAQAVYAGIQRAIVRLDADVTAGYRTNENGTVTITVAPTNNEGTEHE